MREVTLNRDGQQRLRQLFERHNGDRANIDILVREMGGRLNAKQLLSELKRLNLRFGVPTEEQVRCGAELDQLIAIMLSNHVVKV